MEKHMKSLLTIILIMVTLVPATGYSAQEPTVKLGALYNLTGGMSSIDSPACRGSLLAVKLLNKKGGVLAGRTLELVVIDTKTDLQAAKSGAAKLVSIHSFTQKSIKPNKINLNCNHKLY